MPDGQSGKRSVAPAEGERRALRSYTAQYRVAAQLVRDALVDGELEWIRLVDPEAGRLDDIVIGRPGRIDAYQVKWSDYQNPIGFRQLVTASKVSGKPYPAPFTLLAEGWRALRTAYPDHIVRAHFLTHDNPSSKDGTRGAGEGDPVHLQGFLRNAWPRRGNWHGAGQEDFRVEWATKIAAIATSSGMSGRDLDHFLSLCELDLGYDLDDAAGRGRERREEDVADLGGYLMGLVAKSSGAVHLTRHDLLRGLGWSNRFELSFKHDFPVDERLYRPVEETVRAISRAITDHDRGYVALVGPPGSGKSTALTHTLRYARGIRLARYYAFVRDDPRLGRGEAATFLHDLALSLEPLVPRARRLDRAADDPNELRAHIAELLAALSADWTTSGTKTVILIDGLDHIAREQSPRRSLIHELPHPDTVPEGVIFVLGTQQVGLEGEAPTLRPIVAQLAQVDRKLDMAGLSRASIRSIAETAIAPALLPPNAYDRIAELSTGHPLALTYLVKRIAAAADAAAVEAILEATVMYDGEIEADYQVYWNTLDDEPEVRDLLGLVARLRGALDLDSIEALASRRALERFATTAQHYFHQDTPSSWRFFHNSFRQFVLEKTARNALNRPDPKAAAAFHERLAEVGAAQPANSPLAWDRIFHLDSAGDASALLALDHQALFRGHLLSGRPDWEIEEDIHRCLRAAALAGETMTVLGLMLAQKELGDRTSSLEAVDLPTLELSLRPSGDRAGALVSGTKLLVPPDVAIDWAARLAQEGDHQLASRLFDLAEPLDELGGVRRLAASGTDDTLDAWAKTAWRFRTLGKVVEAAHQIQVNVSAPDVAPPTQDQGNANRDAVRHVLVTLALALLAADETDHLADLLALITDPLDAKVLALRLDGARVHRAILEPARKEEGSAALDRILEMRSPSIVSKPEAVRIADMISRLDVAPERADAYLARVSGPLIANALDTSEADPFAPVENLFRQARALAARGRPLDPAVDLPSPPREADAGRILFQRVVVLVATVWGEALRGTIMTPSEVVRRLGPAIRLYRRPFNDSIRWLDWHQAQRSAVPLFDRLLQAARAHGLETFRQVLDAIVSDWTRQERGVAAWSMPVRRGVAMAAYAIDGDRDRTTQILDALDAGITIDLELEERVSEWRGAMDAWLVLGESGKARQARDAMVSTSFGLFSDRDAQIEDWAEIAACAIRASNDPEEQEEAGRLILTILRVLHRTTRGGGRGDAVRIILAALSRLHPGAALQQAAWLLDGEGAERKDVLSGLAIGELASSDPATVTDMLIVVARLILPFDMNPSNALANAIAAIAAGGMADDAGVAGAMGRLRETVSTLVQHRSQFDALMGVARTTASEPRTRHGEPAKVTKADGAILSQGELEILARSPAALADALNGASQVGIEWHRVLAALPATVDRTILSTIGKWLISRAESAFTFRDLVRRAAASGDKRLAEDATHAAMAASRRYGWMQHYDGGSRLAVAECLIITDPARGRRRALEMLVDDQIEQTLPVRDLVGGLDKILPLLCETVDPVAVWAQLRKHVGAVAEVTENPDQAPAFRDADALGAGEMATRLIFQDIDHPALKVASEARKAVLALMAAKPDGFARDALRRALEGSLDRRTAALAVISCLAWSSPDQVGDLVDPVRLLAWDEKGLLRYAAQRILRDLGEALPPAPPRRELPGLFRLHLPDPPMQDRSLRGATLPRGEPLPDTDDSVDLSRIFHDELRQIETDTDLPFAVLARRFSQIMHRLAPHDTWSAAAERALMTRLEAMGMKMNFRRPRSLVVHHAFGTLVAEICDAGLLDWPAEQFDPLLITAEPYMDTKDPVARPDWLDVPSAKSLGEYPRETWFEAVGDALPTLRSTLDGRIVLAEWTSAVSLDHDREEEARVSVVAHWQMTLSDSMPSLYRLWRDPDFVARDYPMLRDGVDRPVAVIAGGPNFCDANFVALNPRIGHHLGWRVSPEGLFRWVDATGALMAESLWWQDGNNGLRDRSGIDQAAYEGWLVLATPVGWKHMRPLFRHFRVQRSAGRSIPPERGGDEDQASVVTDTIAIPD